MKSDYTWFNTLQAQASTSIQDDNSNNHEIIPVAPLYYNDWR